VRITIYGSGCDKCRKLYRAAEEAVQQTGAEAELEKVEGVADIARAGVLFTPGIAIDGKVKATGKVPEAARIAEWIREAGA
jgi:small redox-active disulfide protein 2